MVNFRRAEPAQRPRDVTPRVANFLHHRDLGNECVNVYLPWPQGALVPNSWAGMPQPWVEIPFLKATGDAVIFDARMIHWGSGRADFGPGTPL